MNILSGAVIPTAGRIVFDGAERTFSNPADARSVGIETVYQQLALVEMFDIATNFYLGRERKRGGILGALGFLDRPSMRREASQAVQRLPTSFPDLVHRSRRCPGASARPLPSRERLLGRPPVAS